jgi:hypothetical protein
VIDALRHQLILHAELPLSANSCPMVTINQRLQYAQLLTPINHPRFSNNECYVKWF